ncbi:MAG: dipeptidase [Gemmatimonadaceae bacterium]
MRPLSAVIVLAPLILASVPSTSRAQGDPIATVSPASARARVMRLLRETPVIDGHNDLPWAVREDTVAPRDVEAYDLRKRARGMTDIPRLKQGMVGGQFWSVYIPGERDDPTYAPQGTSASAPGYARVQLEQIDIARRIIDRYPELVPVRTAAELREAWRQTGRVGSLLGMEGGHAIENSLGALRAYYDLGARYLTLTHNVTLDWADAAMDAPTHGGLTPFGEEVVREMNRLGMIVDLSHVSPGTMSDALNVTEAPVIFSHSSARAITDVPRNVPDSILGRLPKNGGVVMVTFVPGFVSAPVVEWGRRAAAAQAELEQRTGSDSAAIARAGAAWLAANPRPRATISDVADHLDHIRKVAGADHVGLGGDFDGITETVMGLEDVSTYPELFEELANRGWSDADMRKLAAENVLRVLDETEKVASRLRAQRPPSTKTIQQLDGGR